MANNNCRVVSRRAVTTVALLMLAAPLTAKAGEFHDVAYLGGSYVRSTGFGVGSLSVDVHGNLYAPNNINEGLYQLRPADGYEKGTAIYYATSNTKEYGFLYNGMTFTSNNDILGVFEAGGPGNSGAVEDFGKVNQLAPVVLHGFPENSSDGQYPLSGLVAGPDKRYYGTTLEGGKVIPGKSVGGGIVYRINDSTTAPKYQVLHRFGGAGDGLLPTVGNLVVDAQGRLFGETYEGGDAGLGTVFMLQEVNGGWQEQVIHSFGISDGLSTPPANLVADPAGNLYGCAMGGTNGKGAIFQLSPPEPGGTSWAEITLYNFGSRANDAVAAEGQASESYGCGLTRDPNTGVIVGVSPLGGKNNLGAIFLLTPPGSGQSAWRESIGYSFQSKARTSYLPLLEVDGVFYGGAGRSNLVFSFTP